VVASVGSEVRTKGTFDCGVGSDGRPRLRIVDIPSLAYHSKPYPDRPSFLQAADELARQILQRIDVHSSRPDCPYILHSHNISLGKNPAATMAFKRIAEIAADRSLPLWLINQVHDLAENNRPEQMRAFFNCTGRRDEAFARSFMYPNAPNIMYLTINSSDIENLFRIGISRNRIFLLPDPIDLSRFEQKPLWEADERELAALGLPPADYRKMLLQGLADYASSRNQVFDATLPILLSPVKVMRRKNNIEALLLLTLLKRLGHRYQLLITLPANSPPDIAYSRQLELFAATHGLPALTGFGTELISGTGQRDIRKGAVRRFSMCDLHSLCCALITTSLMEGFGFVYHEGWLSGRLVLGRRIPEIVGDFESNGMSFDHLYDRLAVSLVDVPHLRERLLAAYGKRRAKSAGVRRNHPGTLTQSRLRDIIEAKIFRAGTKDCVDFADLNVEMQLELIARLNNEPALADGFIDRNPAVSATFRLLEHHDPGLIETNRAVVRTRYSLKATASRLENLLEMGDSLYRKQSECVLLEPERHAAVIERYRTPARMRLLF
jgi:hypothetical protein